MKDETPYISPTKHMGIKISSARRLVGITQQELAERLHVTKQAISKLEQTENIGDDRLSKIAEALGVSLEGLKKFNSETVLYYTNNFYENCGVTATNGGLLGTGSIEHLHSFSVEQAAKLFEELLKIEREKFDNATAEKGGSSKK